MWSAARATLSAWMPLSAPLAVHDVRDLGRLVTSVISSSRVDLTWTEREDLDAYLLATAWELSTRYEPGGSVSFSTWATTTLKLRTIDFVRKERGRTRWAFAGGRVHERERPTFVSLDAEHGDRLDAALAARGGDPADDCDPDLAGVLADGDRTRAGDLAALGIPPARRAS